jgi:hypothetical protein
MVGWSGKVGAGRLDLEGDWKAAVSEPMRASPMTVSVPGALDIGKPDQSVWAEERDGNGPEARRKRVSKE